MVALQIRINVFLIVFLRTREHPDQLLECSNDLHKRFYMHTHTHIVFSHMIVSVTFCATYFVCFNLRLRFSPFYDICLSHLNKRVLTYLLIYLLISMVAKI